MTLRHNRHRGTLAVGIRVTTLILPCWLWGLATGQPTNAGAAEAVVFIVNKANPVDDLSAAELRKYFLLEHDHWPNGRKNTVLMLPPGSPARELVFREIYQFTESEFNRYFIQEKFTGHIQSAPKELASAANVRKFVFNVPGAIGYIRANEVDDTVKVIRVDGRASTDKNYPFKTTPRP
jgi:ABC-type phosphate transport system substrate-binding protein